MQGDALNLGRRRGPHDHPHLASPDKGEDFRIFPMRQFLDGGGQDIAVHSSQFQKCEKASLLRAVASLFL
jgi:hypothetical protein